MSLEAIEYVRQLCKQQRWIEPHARQVLLTLATAHENGRANPSVPQLARFSSVGRHCVQRTLARFVDNGILDVRSRFDSRGQRLPNEYRFWSIDRSFDESTPSPNCAIAHSTPCVHRHLSGTDLEPLC